MSEWITEAKKPDGWSVDECSLSKHWRRRGAENQSREIKLFWRKDLHQRQKWMCEDEPGGGKYPTWSWAPK